MSLFSPATRGLADLMVAAPRGPRRDGLFAVWLTVRIIEDLPMASTHERGYRRRVALAGKRLSSLMLAPPIRRGISAVLASLDTAESADRGQLLAQLAAAVRDAGPPEAAELLARAARGNR